MNKHLKDFKNKHKDKKEIDRVIDYLKKEYDLSSPITEEYASLLYKTNEWVEKLNKGFKKQGKTELIKDFGDGITFVKLIDQDSKSYEGAYLNHCAASYTYEDLYSLRKDGEPLYTIELDRTKGLIQVNGYKNKSIPDKYKEYLWQLQLEKIISFKELPTMARILSYRYDKEYFDFITSNNLLEKIPNKIMSTTIDGVKRNVHLISINSKFKLNKPIREINNLSNDLFLFFVNNKMCHELISFVIDNEKLDEETINKMFEYGITLNYVKDIINKGYSIRENHLLSAINYCNIDVFKFIYEELKIKPDWSLIEKVSLSGRINILDYCVEKGYITIEDLDASFHQYDTSLLPGHMSPRNTYHLKKKLNEKDKLIIEECINQKIISIDNTQVELLVQKMTRYRLDDYKTTLIDKDKMIDYLLTLTK